MEMATRVCTHNYEAPMAMRLSVKSSVSPLPLRVGPVKGYKYQTHGSVSTSPACRRKMEQIRGSAMSAKPVSDRPIAHQVESPVLRKSLQAMVESYLAKTPTAGSSLNQIQEKDGGPIAYDHFAFRTFGVDGWGISSMAQFFIDMGYQAHGELHFPAKKLRAVWFSPSSHLLESDREGVYEPLPRIFISELLVDQMSAEAQAVIKKYTRQDNQSNKYSIVASALNCLPWQTPQWNDFQCLARESEYAAWTLVNGYSLNHLTVSVHRLHSSLRKIEILNQFLQNSGIKLNSEGGILKVSPDGGLQQSSTVADSIPYCFAGDEVKIVPGSYIEFAERIVLPQFMHLSEEEIKEWHRRDGFEVGNADKIFESTSSAQTGVKPI